MQPKLCSKYLAKKNRFCRMPVKHDSQFCGAHTINSIPCPHCSTHLSNSTRYQRHCNPQNPLCPVLKRLSQVEQYDWISPSINSSPQLNNIHHNHHTTPSNYISPIDVLQLLNKHPIHSTLRNLNVPCISQAKLIQQKWTDQNDSTFTYKPYHFTQITQLASRVLRIPFNQSNPSSVAILELGAGRAYTSLYLTHVLLLRSIPLHLIVIDRAASRMKADRVLRSWAQDNNSSLQSFRRIRADVSDVDLTKIPELQNIQNLLVIGKHICGAALDLSLTCVQRLVNERKHKIQISLALLCCCRRLCQWHLFGDQANVWRKWNLTKQQVDMITKAAAWGLDKKHDQTRTTAGQKSRMVVDAARVQWLKDNGWAAWTEICMNQSPENICICAVWPPKDMSDWELIER